jgi:sporulation protein YlmC with PRC-barrel domain
MNIDTGCGAALKLCLLRAAVGLFISLAVAVQAAQAQVTATAPEPKPARQCLSNLQAFEVQIKRDGYWLHASDYGYGYPNFGVNYPNAGTVLGSGESAASAFVRARPGHDVRTMIAAASILALSGQPQACESLLNATRRIYQNYLINARNAQIAKADAPVWREHLIAAATPVSANTASINFEGLIGIDVLNAHAVGLGSVEDVLLNRKTGQIAYLVIGRGGVFGIDEKYVPVPWRDFKVATGRVLLVLDTSQTDMESAPEIAERMFESNVNFGPDLGKADAYWKVHVRAGSAGE